jgi:hypothetical protein
MRVSCARLPALGCGGAVCKAGGVIRIDTARSGTEQLAIRCVGGTQIYGSTSRSGDWLGYGDGDGDGNGNGDGDGTGNGFGFGDGDGDGYRYGYGYGDGIGYGLGDGKGDGER